jgi:hypothetical protein
MGGNISLGMARVKVIFSNQIITHLLESIIALAQCHNMSAKELREIELGAFEHPKRFPFIYQYTFVRPVKTACHSEHRVHRVYTR